MDMYEKADFIYKYRRENLCYRQSEVWRINYDQLGRDDPKLRLERLSDADWTWASQDEIDERFRAETISSQDFAVALNYGLFGAALFCVQLERLTSRMDQLFTQR